MDNAFISVILPNYNHSDYIKIALKELLKQIKYIYEIIIIDDYSTDESVKTIKKFVKFNKKIKFFKNNSNLGCIKTQNKAISIAKGRFLYFAAADDFILPNFFQKCVKALHLYPECGLICGDAILINSENKFLDIRPRMIPSKKTKFFSPEESKKLYLNLDNFILTGSSIIKRELVNKFKKLDPKLNAFADGFMTREISMAFGFVYIPKMVSVWRYYETSFSKSLALDEKKYTEINILYKNKIRESKNFTKQYLKKISSRIIFQRKLTYLNSNKFSKNLSFNFIAGILKIYFFLKLNPVNFFYFIPSIYLYLTKKIDYVKQYNCFKNNNLK